MDWDWVPTAGGEVPELRYKGKKPIPSTVTWLDGFSPLLDPSKVLKSGGTGAMHTFTREFYRPNDRIRQVSADAASRFEEDHRRFPPGSYEEHSLVWKQDRWRQLCPEERAQLLGMLRQLCQLSEVQKPARHRAGIPSWATVFTLHPCWQFS